MLARLARELPLGPEWTYEPKWDGFRCLAFRRGDVVDLRSRNQRPLTRYFPEIVAALRSIRHDAFVLDGELLVVRDGRFDFAALMSRLHPAASRVAELARTAPASFVVFDVLEADGTVLLDRSHHDRRAVLERLVVAVAPALTVSPTTDDPDDARVWLEHFVGHGIDGVVAKRRDAPYEPGRRTMTKVKLDRTAECVVAGLRLFENGDRPRVSSLLLGLYNDDGELQHIGVASSFTNPQREVLARELLPHAVALAGHPWERGFALEGGPLGRLKGAAGRWTPDLELDWVPLAPELVCEVAFDQVDGTRLRHPARFRRWRPDRDARSCTLDQLEHATGDAVGVLRR